MTGKSELLVANSTGANYCEHGSIADADVSMLRGAGGGRVRTQVLPSDTQDR